MLTHFSPHKLLSRLPLAMAFGALAAFTPGPGHAGDPTVWLTDEVFPLAPTPYGTRSTPVVSRDLNRVAYLISGGGVEWVTINGVPARPFISIVPETLRFTGSHQLVYLARSHEGMHVVSGIHTGRAYPSIDPAEIRVTDDGRHVAYLVRQPNDTLLVNDGREDSLGEPNVSRLAISSDGRRVAYVVEQPGGEAVRHDTAAPRWFIQVGQPVFSPDNQRVAFVNDDGLAQRLQVSSTAAGETYGWIGQPAFSPDGKQLAYQYRDDTNRLWVRVDWVDTTDPTKPRLTYDRLYGPYRTLQPNLVFSPNGKRLVFPVEDQANWRIATAPEVDHPLVEIDGSSVRYSPDSQKLAYIGTLSPGQQVVVEDGKIGKVYRQIEPNSLRFSPDSQWLSYAVRIGDERRVVVNGVEWCKYPHHLSTPRWQNAKTLRYLAKEKGEVKQIDLTPHKR